MCYERFLLQTKPSSLAKKEFFYVWPKNVSYIVLTYIDENKKENSQASMQVGTYYSVMFFFQEQLHAHKVTE
jgi:hypothetical protein